MCTISMKSLRVYICVKYLQYEYIYELAFTFYLVWKSNSAQMGKSSPPLPPPPPVLFSRSVLYMYQKNFFPLLPFHLSPNRPKVQLLPVTLRLGLVDSATDYSFSARELLRSVGWWPLPPGLFVYASLDRVAKLPFLAPRKQMITWTNLILLLYKHGLIINNLVLLLYDHDLIINNLILLLYNHDLIHSFFFFLSEIITLCMWFVVFRGIRILVFVLTVASFR